MTARTPNSYVTVLDGAGGTLALATYQDVEQAERYIEALSSNPRWRVALQDFATDPKSEHAVRNGSRVRIEYEGHTVVERPLQFR